MENIHIKQQVRDIPANHASEFDITNVYRHKKRSNELVDPAMLLHPKAEGMIGWVEVPGQNERHFCFYCLARGKYLSPATYFAGRLQLATANRVRNPYRLLRKVYALRPHHDFLHAARPALI